MVASLWGIPMLLIGFILFCFPRRDTSLYSLYSGFCNRCLCYNKGVTMPKDLEESKWWLVKSPGLFSLRILLFSVHVVLLLLWYLICMLDLPCHVIWWICMLGSINWAWQEQSRGQFLLSPAAQVAMGGICSSLHIQPTFNRETHSSDSLLNHKLLGTQLDCKQVFFFKENILCSIKTYYYMSHGR